jgi:pre-rRNA-processing protein TSR3
MSGPIPTTVIRHPKERIQKCSLRFLHDRAELTFLRSKPGFTFDATGFTLLAVDCAPLSLADAGRPLLLLDSTWRWLPQLLACVRGEPVHRSIPPGVRTAYPRASKLWDDPEQGLASVEALYVARRILGDDDPSLLEGYHWRQEFLASLRAMQTWPAGGSS